MAETKAKQVATTLESARADSGLLLARVTPQGRVLMRGLHASFVELPKLAAHLAGFDFDGYILALEPDDSVCAMALLFEGNLVCASALNDGHTLWGDGALIELAQRFAAGAVLEVSALERDLIHTVSGVSERVWRVQPGDNFSGIRGLGDGRVALYHDGSVLAHIKANYRETGAFPAPLRPAHLTLPRVIGAWATERYGFTLRGRDAVNPITDHYNRARAAYGKPALEVLGQLGRGKTPLEVAQTLEKDIAGLEGMVETFVREGLLHRRRDPDM
jgi:hypothetical protein